MNGFVDEEDKTIVNLNNPVASQQPAPNSGLGFNRPMPGGRGPAKLDHTQVAGLKPTQQPEAGEDTSNLSNLLNTPNFNESLYKAEDWLNPQNPLIALAQPVFNEIAALSQPSSEKQISLFREQLSTKLRQYEIDCGHQGIDQESIIYARYCLCTALDEMVNKTGWQSVGAWSQNSLLAEFYGETKGGEKFFDLLSHLLVHPAKHIQILEVMFVILNLGFEGKYHLEPKGYLQLERIKDSLYQAIRLQRGESETSLSTNWQGFKDVRNPLIKYVPAWVLLVVTVLMLASMYAGFKYLADQAGDKTLSNIEFMQVVKNNRETESIINE